MNESKFFKKWIKINVVISTIAIWSIIFYRLHWYELLQAITNYLIDAVPLILGALLGIGTGVSINKKKKP